MGSTRRDPPVQMRHSPDDVLLSPEGSQAGWADHAARVSSVSGPYDEGHKQRVRRTFARHRLRARREDDPLDVPFTVAEFDTAVARLDAHSAPGSDRLPYSVWQGGSRQWRNLLTSFLEVCRKCGQVPTEWKHAVVTPIYKDGDPTVFKNYRPVALMVTLAKVFEALLLPRLRSALETYLSNS